MVSLNIDRITVGGKTVTFKNCYPSSPSAEKLHIESLSPTKEEHIVTYELKSKTPESDLEELFNSDYTVEAAGNSHKLIVSGSDIEVVYANPKLE